MRRQKTKLLMHILTGLSVLFFIVAMFFITDIMLTENKKPSVFTVSIVEDDSHILKQGIFYQTEEVYKKNIVNNEVTYDKNDITYNFKFGYNRD